MKKYWKDQKYRRHKKKHDLKSHRKKLRFFEKRRLRRRHLQGIPFFYQIQILAIENYLLMLLLLLPVAFHL